MDFIVNCVEYVLMHSWDFSRVLTSPPGLLFFHCCWGKMANMFSSQKISFEAGRGSLSTTDWLHVLRSVLFISFLHEKVGLFYLLPRNTES